MNIVVDMPTYYQRRSRHGYSHEEACLCPLRMPLWMFRIEQREGRSMRDMLAEGAAAAKTTGYTLNDFAREWGVKLCTLRHWSTKWDIRWPKGASALQREAARRSARSLSRRNTLAAQKCNRRDTMTDDASHAVYLATQKAESSGRRYGVFSCGPGKFRVRRIYGSPRSALEIITPSWNYNKAYREMSV